MLISETGMALDVAGASRRALQAIIGYRPHGGDNQRWRAQHHPDGSISLVSECSFQQVSWDTSTLPPPRLVQRPCGGGPSEPLVERRLFFFDAGGDCVYLSSDPLHASVVLDVVSAGNYPPDRQGTLACLAPRNASAGQRWSVRFLHK
jgi:hypothetical protein